MKKMHRVVCKQLLHIYLIVKMEFNLGRINIYIWHGISFKHNLLHN